MPESRRRAISPRWAPRPLRRSASHHGRAHPGEPVVPPGGREDASVCFPYGFLQRGGGLKVFEDVDGDGTCDLPGLEATDAVGDREERVVPALADEERILVVVADLAWVCDAIVFEKEQGPTTPST